jgi:hypothetical protein
MDRDKLIEYILLHKPQSDKKSLESLSTNALIMLHFQIELSLLSTN